MAALGRPRLLALRALGLGDLLTAVPALRALSDGCPDHRIVLACPLELAPLAMLSGAVDECVHTRPLARLDPELYGVELAVNLHGRGPESHRSLLALAPQRLVAFSCPEAGVSTGPGWSDGEHEVDRWCRLLRESGIPVDPSRLHLPAPPIDVPASLRGLTIVHPGAGAPARRWPPERFAAVARAQLAEGRRVAVTGGSGEVGLAGEVARLAGIPGDAVLAGGTDPQELAALVASAERVVCGDTGMAHLAVAFGTPSVALFGPTAPSHWGPPVGRPRHRVLWAGHVGDPHGTKPDPGLLAIEVTDVLEALRVLPAPAEERLVLQRS